MKEQEDNIIPSWENIEASEKYKSLDYPSRMKVRRGHFDIVSSKNPEYMQADAMKQKEIRDSWMNQEPTPVASPDDPDFIPGVQRGVQNLQATLYGAGALAGEGLKRIGAEKVGQTVQDFGMKGYRRNIEEAKQYPKKHSFKDIYTGKTGIGGAIDWIQGTLGELVPSMVESAAGAAIGASVGSSVPVAGTSTGAVLGAFATRKILKKGIDKTVQRAMKQGIGNLTENELRKQVTRQALKKFGGKVGLGAAVMPMESGGIYAELLEEHGVNAPETALLAGALKTSIEFLGGNSKLVDTFVDALATGTKGLVKKSAKEILTNIPQEALQEGGQELVDIFATVAETDEKLLTTENVESIIESMAAGAVGGSAGALISSSMDTTIASDNTYEGQLQQHFDNIKSQGTNKIPASIKTLTSKINKNNQMLRDPEGLAKLAKESGYDAADLQTFITAENEFTQDLVTKLQEELTESNQEQGTDPTTEQTEPSISMKNAINQFQADTAMMDIEQSMISTSVDVQRQADMPNTAVNAKSLLHNSVLQKIRTGQEDTFTYEEGAYYDEYVNAMEQQQKLNQRRRDIVKAQEEFDNAPEAELPTAFANSMRAEAIAKLPTKLLTNQNKPYKSRKRLETRIASLSAEAEYAITETADGFIATKKELPGSSTSPFIDKQQLAGPSQVVDVSLYEQISLAEDQITTNQQQLDAINNQLINATDPDERIALQQQSSALYAETVSLQQQINKQYEVQEQVQGTSAEANAETAGFYPQLQTTEQATSSQVSLSEIEKMFPGQQVIQDDTGTINVRLRNGKGITFKSIQDAGQGFVKIAIETGQMSKKGKILGITVGNEVLLDAKFADDRTLWHENKHVLDNLDIITEADNAALNKEFNKLRKANKLEFTLSTAVYPKTGQADHIKRMKENRANMFAQIMTNREAYRETTFGKMAQRVMDFFQQLFAFGKQTISGLAREAESGKLYERKINGRTVQTVIPQAEVMADKWYSAIENAVKRFQQKQALPEQWKGMLKNIPEIKQTELDWIGVNDWLESQKGKVTKDALLKFIQDNNIQLEEVVKESINDKIGPLGFMYSNVYGKPILISTHNGKPIESDKELPKEVLRIIHGEAKDTNYKDYSLSLGKNYKELLIILKNNQNYSYQSDHFGEKNILTHIRFDERTDIDDNKILFIEEVQSDWHQDGRKLGYQEYPIFDIIKKYAEQRGIKIDTTSHQDLSLKTIRQLRKVADKKGESALLEDILDQHTKEVASLAYGDIVSNAPMKKTWPLLAMKRMVRYAAENGFDKIAWTTGQQQSDRYGSPGFRWLKHSDGSFEVAANLQIDNLNADTWNNHSFFDTTIKTINNKQDLYNYVEDILVDQESDYSPGNWEKYISNQTDKLWMQMQESSDGTYYPRLEGMKGFYDKALPQTLNKEFNKARWGKARVEVIEMSIGQQLALPITKQMRDKALRLGMSQFMSRELTVPEQAVGGLLNKKTNTNTPEFKQWFGKSVAKKADGSPVELYHGTDAVFDTFTKDTESKTNHATSALGHFFSVNTKMASKYGQHTLPVYLQMRNPYKMSLNEAQSLKTLTESKQRQQDLRDNGYDSIIIATGATPYIVVFESSQVKSVYNQGDWKAADNIYFETREQRTSQKLSDAQYEKSFKQKNNIIQTIMQTARIRGHELKQLGDRLTGSISTRLANANPMLRDKMRRLDFDTSQKVIKALHTAKPLLDKLKDMSPADRHAWDLARKQADTVKINKIVDRYDMREDQEKLREVMNQIRQDAIDVGYSVGFIDDYWPRVIKDTEGFLQATQGISQQSDFTNAIKEKANQMGITIAQMNRDFPDVRADIISNMILGKGSGIGGPGNIKSRVYAEIPEGLEKFYMDSDAALMQYIYSMTKKIEARRFFGKVPPKIQAHKLALAKANAELLQIGDLDEQTDRKNVLKDLIILHKGALNKYKNQRDYTENIGSYIDELMLTGKLKKQDEHIVRQILEARFNEHGTTGVVNAYKNLAYIDVMGNVISAMTQIADLAWGAYVGKVWTPRGFNNTIQNTIKATLGRSKMTKEALGLERIAQEFADGTTLGNAVSKIFNVVGLTKMDSIGKEVLINNTLLNYQNQVKTDSGIKTLTKEIRSIFGAETNQVIKDLVTDTHSDNVKMLIYSKVLDFQPIALSEMPELYLKGGNGRIFYMLKTYTLKQLDVFRKEVFQELVSKDPRRIAQGLKNMTALLSILTLANAGVDELKDLVMGRETNFKDNVIENFLTLGGASRYMRMQVSNEGIGSAIAQKILPPFKFINAISSDLREKIVTGDIEKGLRSVESIPSFGPIGGKLWYWHYGRGSQTKKTLDEKDFARAGKRFRKFKKKIEKASDKRLFLHTNVDEFKQMMLYQNMRKPLNENKADINALKKLEQTPAVIKRLGQLEKYRKLIYERYFEAVKNLTAQ